MASIASLQYDRGQYQELIIQLNSVCNHLDSAADETSQIKPTMDRNYTLNDDVIPAIEDKISQIDSQIAALEEEERMRESGITRWNSSGWWY